MGRHFLRAVGCGIAGLVLASAIVYFATATWTSLSSRWINSGAVLPILGLIGGLALAEKDIGERRETLRRWLALAAVPLCTLGNYLAWMITCRAWFADRIPPEHQAFLDQFLHPSVLPTFVTRSGGAGSYGSEETYLEYLIVGALVGPFIFWIGTRERLRS